MNVFLFGLAAIALYVTAAVRTSTSARTALEAAGGNPSSGGLTLLAIAAHAVALYPMLRSNSGINLGVFNAASLVAWLVATSVFITTLIKPVHSLSVVILPFAALVLGVSLVFSSERVFDLATPGLTLHVALSMLAYSLFAIAALQAVFLAFAEHRLKQHEPVFGFLPPLPTMEQVLFQLTAIAFVLLSLGLLLGGIYIEDIRHQHLAHKIFFSVLAWTTFAALLVGRYHYRWRGRRAVKYVIAGFVMLALGFFGSKIALELILKRV